MKYLITKKKDYDKQIAWANQCYAQEIPTIHVKKGYKYADIVWDFLSIRHDLGVHMQDRVPSVFYRELEAYFDKHGLPDRLGSGAYGRVRGIPLSNLENVLFGLLPILEQYEVYVNSRPMKKRWQA